MALLIYCLKQVVKFCFVEQWRVRVFLVLNMVLLAIYFCSIYANSESEESNCNEEMKTKRQYRRPVSVEAGSDSDNSMKIRNAEDEIEQEEEQKQEHVKVDGKSTTTEISEEELNKRVEAFITMFRQHLASDARRSRNHQFLSSKKQTENLRSQKECNLTQKVRCVTVQV
ncbi:hypothetical protein HS088_TW06G01028 [Tripterygium wilfordii]|uniref:Uncharacterized protein n=1 Tax=Tripterygium wilfordii TaxID=458696 RepID=A0A7J7DKG2_TRIWF|nr:uncharacterized protein LOC120000100 [Tripterygium wilfordii]KAF5746852.1 hypothetical protein HS088_TW06G01028 [Tripterygium wilfordii]